jgi:hypothetical protein
MSATLAHASPGHGPSHRILTLTALFWAFSYALLSLRSAILHDDWARLVDDNRLLAVTFGAGALALVLRQLEARERLTLRRTVIWIVGATAAIMIVRLAIDEMLFDAPHGIGINLLWSLAWSGYFGLWVMGAIAFAPASAASPAASFTRTEAVAKSAVSSVELDNFELLVAAILAEAAELTAADGAALAARVLALGGYETVDGPARDNERARLALRLAARLAAQSRLRGCN